MSRDRWDGLLAGHALLAGLAREGARRRHARERSEEEDEFDVEGDLDDAAPVRLAAADDERAYSDANYTVVVRLGQATQTAGPAGLTLLVGDARIVLAPGVSVPLPSAADGEALVGIDARGRQVRLLP